MNNKLQIIIDKTDSTVDDLQISYSKQLDEEVKRQIEIAINESFNQGILALAENLTPLISDFIVEIESAGYKFTLFRTSTN